MNDTSPAIHERMREIFARKTPEERLLMACSMYDCAKKLVVSSIVSKNPDATPNEIRVEVFRRFYGRDFTPEQQVKILERLTRQ